MRPGTEGPPRERRRRSGLLLVLFSAAILAAPAVAALFDRLPVPGGPAVALVAENASHFRLPALLLAAGGALLALRAPFVRRAALVLAVLHGGAILAYHPPSSAPARAATARPTDGRFRLLYANLGWPQTRRPADLAALIGAERPDLLALVEYDDEAAASLAPVLAAYPHRAGVIRPDRFGAAFFSRWPIADSEIVPLDPSGLPSIRVRLTDPSIEFRVVHPLAPGSPEARARRDEALGAIARAATAADGALVVVGDLNTTERSAAFRRLLAAGLRDTREGYGYSPTWPATPPPLEAVGALLAIPLDHALIAGHVETLDRRVGPAFGSDHLPLLLDLPVAPRANRRVGSPKGEVAERLKAAAC